LSLAKVRRSLEPQASPQIDNLLSTRQTQLSVTLADIQSRRMRKVTLPAAVLRQAVAVSDWGQVIELFAVSKLHGW
jgi:hypothetical protein